MRKLVGVAVGVLVLAGAAAAQVPRGNIFFGYSYLNSDVIPNQRNSFNGWNASLEGKLIPLIGIVGDFGGYYGTHNLGPSLPVDVNQNTYTVMFGPRISASVGKFTPFAQALFGVGHISESGGGFSDSDTSFATAVGGGLDYKLIPLLAWRFEGDYLHTQFFGNTQADFRFSTGIVLHF